MSTQANWKGHVMMDPFEGLEVTTEKPKRKERKATQPQISFIRDLADRRDWSGLNPSLREHLTGDLDEIPFKLASPLIDALKACPFASSRQAEESSEPPEGIHYVEATETVYKVQVAHNGSGKKYAKQLHTDPDGDRWEYQGRNKAFWSLGDGTLMTLEQAQAFGRLYGMCCVCGATLTDETSIAAGIGPVCGRRL